MTEMLRGSDLITALAMALGLDGSRVRRIVIDAAYNDVVVVYVEQIGAVRMLEIDWPGHLKDARIRQIDRSQEAMTQEGPDHD